MPSMLRSIAFAALLAGLAIPAYANAPDPKAASAPPTETVTLDSLLSGSPKPETSMPMLQNCPPKDCAQERMRHYTEMKINSLHAKLGITPKQEKQWSKVAAVMRQNDEAMMMGGNRHWRKMRKMRHMQMSETMGTGTGMGMGMGMPMQTVPEALQTREQMMEKHVKCMKKFGAAFMPLYNSMSAEQKKTADMSVGEMFSHPHPMMNK